MKKLPVIVGIGGINAAGRSSGFHSYKRMLCETLTAEELNNTWHDLANRMELENSAEISADTIETIKAGTLVRRIENFDPDNVLCHHKSTLEKDSSLLIKKSKLSKALKENFDIAENESQHVKLTAKKTIDILLPDTMPLPVTSAGSIPKGFDLSKLYNSHHHPRGLQLAVYGASDALNSLGFEWSFLLEHIRPDQISVYAGSALSQIDENSLQGLIAEPLCGNRINSKMMALSLAEMPADFVNSYVINSVGNTGNNVGACASFLYNLRQGMLDIQLGKARVALVGNAEAPIVPEVIEGFRVMGALATDESICKLDESEIPNNRRACRPFSSNSGFTLAEAAQFFILMDDELALQLGANIYGSVADVFVNADANKKSIASPGIGNYITVAKATALAKAILGEQGLQKTYVSAHGTGTPQNRTTESHILNEVAKTFGIKSWPVTAIKSYVGHSVSVAGGDQLLAALGVWQYGFIPGIKTIDHIASDVHQTHLNILTKDHAASMMEAAIINSKGFGGNNATGLILSPQKTLEILENRYGASKIASYKAKNQPIKAQSDARDLETCHGNERIIYKFGETVMDQASVSITTKTISLSEFKIDIDLPTINPYA